MKNLKSRLSKVRAKIRKGNPEESILLLNLLQQDIEDKLLTLNQLTETRNKKAVPTNKRFLEVEKAEGSTHRLTIAPQTGRITLKISEGASDIVVRELINFVDKCIRNDDSLAPVTYRGKVTFYNGKYSCYLSSESKKFSKKYEYEITLKEENVNE
jgi:hypothetical protein